MVRTQQAVRSGAAQAVSNGLDLLSHGRADPSCPVCVVIASHQHLAPGVVEEVLYSLAFRGAMIMLACQQARPGAMVCLDAKLASTLKLNGRLGLLCLTAGKEQHLPQSCCCIGMLPR